MRIITVRMSDDLKQRVVDESENAGVSQEEFCRLAIREVLRLRSALAGGSDRINPELTAVSNEILYALNRS